MTNAVKDGPEAIVSWAQTLLVYGPVSMAPPYETLVNEKEKLVKEFARRQYSRGGQRQSMLDADLSALFRMVSLKECVTVLAESMDVNVVGEAIREVEIIWRSLHDLQRRYEKRVVENGMESYCTGTDFQPVYFTAADEAISRQAQASRVREGKEKKAMALNSRTGLLLPLRCGHNAALKPDEAAQLDGVLSDMGWC
jgi:hypothetical protein